MTVKDHTGPLLWLCGPIFLNDPMNLRAWDGTVGPYRTGVAKARPTGHK